MSKPPLWEVMYDAFWKCTRENWRLSSAFMIIAIRDWLLPEEAEPEDDGVCDGLDFLEQLASYEERQRLRALLTTEAERAANLKQP